MKNSTPRSRSRPTQNPHPGATAPVGEEGEFPGAKPAAADRPGDPDRRPSTSTVRVRRVSVLFPHRSWPEPGPDLDTDSDTDPRNGT